MDVLIGELRSCQGFCSTNKLKQTQKINLQLRAYQNIRTNQVFPIGQTSSLRNFFRTFCFVPKFPEFVTNLREQAYFCHDNYQIPKETLNLRRGRLQDLQKVLEFERKRVYINAQGRSSRFSEYVCSVISDLKEVVPEWIVPFKIEQQECDEINYGLEISQWGFHNYGESDLDARVKIVQKTQIILKRLLDLMDYSNRRMLEKFEDNFIQEAQTFYLELLQSKKSDENGHGNNILNMVETKQRSEEWHKMRSKRLTASDFSTALGIWGQERIDELFGAKVGYSEGFKGNEATQYGTEKESEALEWYIKFTGFKISHAGLMQYKNGSGIFDSGWLAGSPDGLINGIDPEKHPASNFNQQEVENLQRGEQGLLEIKCPYTRIEPYHNLPPYYLPQIQGLMQITKRDWCHLYSWTPLNSTLFYIRRDDEYWQTVLDILQQFWWDHVVPARLLYTRQGNESEVTKRAPQIRVDIINKVKRLNEEVAKKAVKYSFDHHPKNATNATSPPLEEKIYDKQIINKQLNNQKSLINSVYPRQQQTSLAQNKKLIP